MGPLSGNDICITLTSEPFCLFGTLQSCSTAKKTKRVKQNTEGGHRLLESIKWGGVNAACTLLMELYFNLDQARSDSSSWFGTLWSLSDGGDLTAGFYSRFNRLLSAKHSTQHRKHSGMQLNGPIQLHHREGRGNRKKGNGVCRCVWQTEEHIWERTERNKCKHSSVRLDVVVRWERQRISEICLWLIKEVRWVTIEVSLYSDGRLNGSTHT